MTALAASLRPLLIDDAAACADAARQLAEGAVVANAFANFYVITTRGDAETVCRVNGMKGRPPGQVGSITGSPAALWEVWDLTSCPRVSTRVASERSLTPSSPLARSASEARRRHLCRPT